MHIQRTRVLQEARVPNLLHDIAARQHLIVVDEEEVEELGLLGRHVILPFGRHHGAHIHVQDDWSALKLMTLEIGQQPGQHRSDFGCMERQMKKGITGCYADWG